MMYIFNFLPDYFSNLLGTPISNNPRLVIDVVAVLLLVFLGWYVVQAIFAILRLSQALRDLKKVCQQESDGIIVSREQLQQVFKNKFFASVWDSFRDTLHEQHSFQGGQQQLASIRSTVPAAAVFSSQSLVDARLNVEFFKHLPGILTGIGIIGTFYGLINGIQHFDPSLLAKAKTDPAQMDKLFGGLKILFDEVQGAFIASFFAIGAAMLITLAEKVLLNICYRQLEQLCQKLDALYEGGVGEDYLAALVKSSAENATQTAQLKQSLVTELSELLSNLSKDQGRQSEVLGNLLSAKIQEHIDVSENHSEKFRADLKEGLADIGKTVAGVAGGQGETMTGMLEKLIGTFSENIKSTFDEQMTGQAKMIEEASDSMKEMQNGFKTLLTDLRDSGKLEREDLTSKVTSLVGTLENQQTKLEKQITTFVDSIQSQIGNDQAKTVAQMEKNLKEIQGSVNKVLTEMEHERTEAISLGRKQQTEFADSSNNLMTKMGVQVGGLLDRNEQMVESMGKKVTVQLDDSLSSIHASVSKLLTEMENERRATVDAEREIHRQFTGASQKLVLDMEQHISQLVEEIGKTALALNQNVTALDKTVITAINGMNDGATQISSATGHFVEAGNKVSNVMNQTEIVSAQLVNSAGSLALASKSLDTQLGQYAVTRDALAQMVSEMNEMLARAKNEAGVNQQLIQKMQHSADQFIKLNDEADKSFDGISKKLAETLAKFRDDMSAYDKELHTQHDNTLNLVASAYQPLAASIAGLTDMIATTRRI